MRHAPLNPHIDFEPKKAFTNEHIEHLSFAEFTFPISFSSPALWVILTYLKICILRWSVLPFNSAFYLLSRGRLVWSACSMFAMAMVS
jgi:hypothetical protein